MPANDTYDRALLTLELMRDEGTKLKPYTDTEGKLTIGTGRNLTDVGIAESEAAAMLANDIIRVEMELDEEFTWWRTMNTVRQRVLLNMAFNMGMATLLTFTHTLAALASTDYTLASQRMLQSRWAEEVGARASRLSQMMASGQDVNAPPTPNTAVA